MVEGSSDVIMGAGLVLHWVDAVSYVSSGLKRDRQLSDSLALLHSLYYYNFCAEVAGGLQLGDK